MESEILEREINVDLPDNQILISYQALRSISFFSNYSKYCNCNEFETEVERKICSQFYR